MSRFNDDNYRAINNARLEWLAQLKLFDSYAGLKVLDLGAGDGVLLDMFMTPRGAILHCVEAREENYNALVRHRPHLAKHAQLMDLEQQFPKGKYDLTTAFGLFYHLGTPVEFLKHCAESAPVFILDTVIVNETGNRMFIVDENAHGYDQAYSGYGARATLEWIHEALNTAGFKHVYESTVQVEHQDYRLWNAPITARAIRIASMKPLNNERLKEV